ncbi:aspartate carbamoyltransferase regulatory subunit [Candidatus Falkowbacteria bacterium]|jgi:aspartate carbamoyltransferase regulatory subunit|nr:aspartate carbamoyltransferase regulatory subunit [Candidatus Falkowbacteria bacterium]
MHKKTLSVAAIKNGTVIDHITAGHALKIVRLLNLADHNKIVTLGLNLPSKENKYKDIIKVEGRELNPKELRRVAIFAPHATINIIENYEIVKKFKTEMPETVEYVIVCPNPNCITNNEIMDSKFHVKQEGKNIKLKCNYCEKSFDESEIQKYKNN